MPNSLLVNEIFYSIQGEGTRAGRPCVFVRLTGCHLRCVYCDTAYAFHEGSRRNMDDIIEQVRSFACPLVQITGGEPLLQAGVHDLMQRLCDDGFTVMLETSGACDISCCDPRVIRIVDLKTPDSGESERNDWTVIEHLAKHDELKFVITSRHDYEWTRQVLAAHDLTRKVKAVLLSPVHDMAPSAELPGATGLPLHDLASWILEDKLPVRIQPQLHKFIWDPLARGV